MSETIKYPIRPPNGAKLNPEYFPEELIALRVELEYHPKLQVILAGQADKDIYIQLSEIATYCDIILDGAYTRDDIIKLCDLLVRTLQKKRVIIIN